MATYYATREARGYSWALSDTGSAVVVSEMAPSGAVRTVARYRYRVRRVVRDGAVYDSDADYWRAEALARREVDLRLAQAARREAA